jgi:transcriptional regulator with XRE-family HTH domain
VVLLEKIGTIIRKHRGEQGLTQEELGAKVFVSKQAVSKWETGKTLPDIEMVRKLCDILEISKDEILGGSIEETKKSRKWLKVVTIISVIIILAVLFFGLDGFGYIDRHTQSGIAYVSVFEDGELLTTDEYSMASDLDFEDFKNGYKFEINYGEIRGTISLPQQYDIEFGFVNTNNWHNVHIRLDIEKQNSQIVVNQTISYETDNKVYQVTVIENTITGNNVSVYREGV